MVFLRSCFPLQSATAALHGGTARGDLNYVSRTPTLKLFYRILQDLLREKRFSCLTFCRSSIRGCMYESDLTPTIKGISTPRPHSRPIARAKECTTSPPWTCICFAQCKAVGIASIRSISATPFGAGVLSVLSVPREAQCTQIPAALPSSFSDFKLQSSTFNSKVQASSASWLSYRVLSVRLL